MKNNFILLFLLLNFAGKAQNADWGTGLEVGVTPLSSSLYLTVYDSTYSANITYDLYTGSAPNYRNVDGVVVGYGTNQKMTFATYDWDFHSWAVDSINLGTSNVKILTADGIVAGYGSTGNMAYAFYDVNQHLWKTGTQTIGSFYDTLTVADGIVAGYASDGNLDFSTYDAQRHSWMNYSMPLGTSFAKIANSDGVVIGYGNTGNLVYATYSIELQTWQTGSTFIGTSNAQIATSDGIVAAYGSTNKLQSAIYDIYIYAWMLDSINIGSSGSFTLSSGLITYSGTTSSGIRGYNSATGNWQASPTTVECKFLPYHIANSPWVRMRCMSTGGGTFTYSCGDGHQIYRKEGWKKYDQNGTYTAALNVSNGTNNSTCNSLIDITSGISENDKRMFSISPNPAHDIIHLNFSSVVTGKIYVVNYLGQKVYQRQIINEDNIDFNISQNGIYMVLLENNGHVYSQRLEILN